MNSRERLTATFKAGKVDRLPVSPFIWANNVYEMFKYKPRIEDNFNPEDFDLAGKFVEYNDYFGFDTLFSPGFLWDSFIPPPARDWDVKITKTGSDDKQKRTTVVSTPEGELTQVMNFERSSTHLLVLALEKYAIETKKDFEIFRKFAPPARFIDCGMMRRGREAVGDKGLVNVATFGAFNVLNMFRRLETMMMDPFVDEGFYREMMDFFAGWNMNHLRGVVKAGADSIELGGNLATSVVGPAFFKNHVMEYENRLARGIHEEGAFVVYHNCGDAQKIMHLYNDLEIDVWGYLTPPPFGDVILDDALKTIRPNMALRGNIDQVEFLRKAAPPEIRKRMKSLVDKVKTRGNWIISTTDFFFDGTSYENIRAFAEAGREYGGY
jgi:hypothetical protein